MPSDAGRSEERLKKGTMVMEWGTESFLHKNEQAEGDSCSERLATIWSIAKCDTVGDFPHLQLKGKDMQSLKSLTARLLNRGARNEIPCHSMRSCPPLSDCHFSPGVLSKSKATGQGASAQVPTLHAHQLAEAPSAGANSVHVASQPADENDARSTGRLVERCSGECVRRVAKLDRC